jgi:cell wall-associated NlpC family hydrolase
MKLRKITHILICLATLFSLAGCSAYREEALERMRKERESENESNESYNKKEESTTFKGTSYTGKTDEQILDVLKKKKFRNLSSQEMGDLMERVKEYLHTPYLWGGESKEGIDCSSFVQNVMHMALGVSLPRTSLEQSKKGSQVGIDNLSLGDLIFFDTMNKGHVTHVGIYLDEGLFVHSGSRTGVAIASLNDEFYNNTFLFAKRVL